MWNRTSRLVLCIAAIVLVVGLLAMTGNLRTRGVSSSLPLLEATIARHGRPILIPVQLSEQEEVLFILDTGAAVTVFDASLKPKAAQFIDKGRFETSAGTLELDVYPCPEAMIGALDLTIVPMVAFSDLASIRAAVGHDIMGILGVDFLQHYAVELDFDLGTLRLV